MSESTAWRITSGTLPWTRSCFVCGQDNPRGLRQKSRIEDDRVVLDYVTRESDLGWRHIVHGGITMTLLDEVMTWAAILTSRCACVAAEMTTRLKAPVAVDRQLRVEGMVTRSRRGLVLTAGRVLDTNGKLLVSATGKYLPMPGDGHALCRDDFVVGPGAVDLHDILDRDGQA